MTAEAESSFVDLLFTRARTLEALGNETEARAAYLDVLTRAPTHPGALHQLGTLLLRTGFPDAAQTVLAELVKWHPADPAGHTLLGMLALDSEQIDAARAHLTTALSLDPDNLQAHQTLAVLLLRLGEPAAARRHAEIGFKHHAETWPYRGEASPVRLLVLLSALGGNVGIEHFVDDRVFLKSTIVTEFFDPSAPLPPHDLILNAIGDADRCAPALEAAARLVGRSQAHVINQPDRVLATSRAINNARFVDLPGVVAARTVGLSRDALAGPDAATTLAECGFGWPVLVRTPGFHTGHHFLKVDGPADLPSALATLPGAELLVIEYLDARSPDGKVRKYRVMTIDGRLYPLHLALSTHWMIHYYTADMADNAAHRAEDEAFLRDMPGVLGSAALSALQSVSDVLGLDYGGIDFSVDADGSVLVYEANATMVIVTPDVQPQWAYRRAPVERVRDAAREMLLDRAGVRRPRRRA